MRIRHNIGKLLVGMVWAFFASMPLAHASYMTSQQEPYIADDSCTYYNVDEDTKKAELSYLNNSTSNNHSQLGHDILMGFIMVGKEDCNADKDKVTFCYNPPIFYGGPLLAGGAPPSCGQGGATATLSEGDAKVVLGTVFQALRDGDYLCVYTNSMLGWKKLGCRKLPTEGGSASINAQCFVSPACYDKAKSKAQSLFRVSGLVTQCVLETLERVFINTSTDCAISGTRTNLFIDFQNAMRKSIGAALMLYVIFFGISVALGQRMPKSTEVFVLAFKVGLVFYFSLGNGIQNDLFPAFLNGSSSLSNIVFQSGGAPGLCVYNTKDYDSNYSYLAMWDSVDCHIAYYFGVINGNTPELFNLIVPSFWAFGLLYMVFAGVFAVMLLSIMVWVIHTYLVAMIYLTIVAYLGPIFVPMALFKQTKAYFDSWINLLFACALQPIILFGFLAFMLSIFDNVVYEGCRFTESENSAGVRVYVIDKNKGNYPDESNYEKCLDSFGYQLFTNANSNNKAYDKVSLVFFDVVVPNTNYWSATGDAFKGIMLIAAFSFIFYHFVEMLGPLASDLTGQAPIVGKGSSPNRISDAVGRKAQKAGDFAIGKMVGGKKKEGGGENKGGGGS